MIAGFQSLRERQPKPVEPKDGHVGAQHVTVDRMRGGDLGTGQPVADAEQPIGRKLLEHLLAGIQYAIGDLKADDSPSAK